MFIKKIILQNYKSFKDKQTILCGDKNIIIGRNGSGKSNLISSIFSIFLAELSENPHFNKNEEDSIVEIEIDNSEGRFPLPPSFTIKMIYKDSQQYFINERAASRDELIGMIENAGLHQYNFIFQGFKAIYDGYKLISRVAGVEKYEANKKEALKYLNENEIEEMIEKLELKSSKYSNFSQKLESFSKLQIEKKTVELELAKHQINEINEKVDQNAEEVDNKSEGMIELEINDLREKIYKKTMEISEITNFIDKSMLGFDKKLINLKESKKENLRNDLKLEFPFIDKLNELEAEMEKKNQIINETLKKCDENAIELKALKLFELNGRKEESEAKLNEMKNQKISEINDCKKISKNIESLISNRKNLWIKQKSVGDRLNELKESQKKYSERILYLGRQDINVYDSMKDEEGVIGTVFSIFDIPEQFIDSFEAVARGSLFNIIVENESVSLRCIEKSKGIATYIPINKLKQTKYANEQTGLNKLSDQILKYSDQRFYAKLSEEKYKNILEFICRNFYCCSTLEKAIFYSKKFGINTVTSEGDIVTYNGIATGGFEPTNSILREIKQIKKDIEKESKELENVKKEISDITREIELYDLEEDEHRNILNLKGVVKYLEMKIEFMKNKTIDTRIISNVEKESIKFQNMLHLLQFELTEFKSQVLEMKLKKQTFDQIIQSIENRKAIKVEISQLQEKVKNLEEKVLDYVSEYSIEETNRQILIEKRSSLMKQFNIPNMSGIVPRYDKSTCLEKLKEIVKNLKDYSMFDSANKALSFKGWDKMLDVENVKSDLKKLKDDKTAILNFIDELERRKEETINLTFSMVSSNYTYFYKAITGDDSTLELDTENSALKLVFGGTSIDIESLSGGQKTVVSICLIFAIQRVDPSPFYVFDEIDASLDLNHCSRIYELIRNSDAQFFITSFKPDSFGCGNKFFGVISDQQASHVAEIDKELAQQTLMANILE